MTQFFNAFFKAIEAGRQQRKAIRALKKVMPKPGPYRVRLTADQLELLQACHLADINNWQDLEKRVGITLAPAFTKPRKK